jgi:ParB family chromosome partitioning protein
VSKLKSNEELAKQFGESREKIRRYIRLTELILELLELVVNSLIKNSILTVGVTSAVEMSYLSKDAQKLLYGVIIYSETTPTLSQARRIRKLYEDKKLTFDSIEEIFDERVGIEEERITFNKRKIEAVIPKEFFKRDKRFMEEYIINAIMFYNEYKYLKKEK